MVCVFLAITREAQRLNVLDTICSTRSKRDNVIGGQLHFSTTTETAIPKPGTKSFPLSAGKCSAITLLESAAALVLCLMLVGMTDAPFTGLRLYAVGISQVGLTSAFYPVRSVFTVHFALIALFISTFPVSTVCFTHLFWIGRTISPDSATAFLCKLGVFGISQPVSYRQPIGIDGVSRSAPGGYLFTLGVIIGEFLSAMKGWVSLIDYQLRSLVACFAIGTQSTPRIGIKIRDGLELTTLGTRLSAGSLKSFHLLFVPVTALLGTICRRARFTPTAESSFGTFVFGKSRSGFFLVALRTDFGLSLFHLALQTRIMLPEYTTNLRKVQAGG
jgi:hypothetical protein